MSSDTPTTGTTSTSSTTAAASFRDVEPTRHLTDGRRLVRSSRDGRALRLVLGTNAATSIIGGLVALFAGTALDELLGTGHPGWVRAVGAGLVMFGVVVAEVARSSTDRLVRLAPVVSVADAGWVVFTIVTVLAGWYSAGGAITMSILGVAVAVFGVEQVLYARRLGAVPESSRGVS